MEDNKIKILDLGCGKRKVKGAIGVDHDKTSDADVFCDLTHFPYPFKENAFDLIYCIDVLEHFDDTIRIIEEVYRISKPGTKLIIGVPHFSSHNFYTDITHKKAFAVRSFDFFSDDDSSVIKYLCSKARFKILKKKIVPNKFIFKIKGKLIKILNIPLEYLINCSTLTQDIYERFFAFILTAESVYFELMVKK